jgi:hypothetical protein
MFLEIFFILLALTHARKIPNELPIEDVYTIIAAKKPAVFLFSMAAEECPSCGDIQPLWFNAVNRVFFKSK